MLDRLFIRKASLQDKKALINIGHKDHEAVLFFPNIKTQLLNHLRGISGQCYVVNYNSEVIGSIYFQNYFCREKVLFYGYLCVSKTFRNKGVGTYLIKECLEIYRQKRFLKVFCFVRQDNIPSIKLHENFGYKKLNFFLVSQSCQFSNSANSQLSSFWNVEFMDLRTLDRLMLDNLFNIYQKSMGEDYIQFFGSSLLRENFILPKGTFLQNSYHFLKECCKKGANHRVTILSKDGKYFGYCLKHNELLKVHVIPEFLQKEYLPELALLIKNIAFKEEIETIHLFGLIDVPSSILVNIKMITMGKNL